MGDRVPIGNPIAYVIDAQRAGLGARAALRIVRESGGAVRTQDWYRAWRAARDGA